MAYGYKKRRKYGRAVRRRRVWHKRRQRVGKATGRLFTRRSAPTRGSTRKRYRPGSWDDAKRQFKRAYQDAKEYVSWMNAINNLQPIADAAVSYLTNQISSDLPRLM